MAEVRIERRVEARPERVWRALTDAPTLAAWFWPASFGTVVAAEPTPGGTFRIEAASPPMAVHGEYLEVDPPHRLVFTWRWDGEDETTTVTIELAAAGTGTALTLVHGRFADDASRDNHSVGWSDCLARLLELFEPVDEDDPDAADGQPPSERERRDPTHPRRPNRPRLLGGPEDIDEAVRPTALKSKRG
jgi:uncharacterized protein YndB with AHSA1/START domain